MSIQSEIDRIAGAKPSLGNYLQQNGVAVPSGATVDEMALQLADVIEKQNKITVSGILKGDGAGGVSAAVPGKDYLTEAPVTSVNSKTGAVKLAAGDVGAVSKTGDTMTGNLTVGSASLQTNGYVTGTWLRTTANTALSSAASKIAVINDGWVYTRTAAQIKSDIGLSNVDNVKQYSASNPPPYPVKSVNGHTGAVTVHEVPTVTTADNGKFLRVVNGVWAAAEITNANGGSF